MADEATVAVAETAHPKMRVKLMLSHPTNNRPKVKMARVDGCTFFRRETMERTEDGIEVKKVFWKHVDNPCERTDHWTWAMEILVGQCTLIRSGGEWRHKGAFCMAAQLYNEVEEKADAANAALKKNATEKKLDAKAELELFLALEKFGAMEKPPCLLDSEDIPKSVGGCEFALYHDVFHHWGLRCKQKEHYQDSGDRKIRLIRSRGCHMDEFTKAANEAIGQALAMVPPNQARYSTVEV